MKEEIQKGKCQYCGVKITPESIRCMNCDEAWQDGRISGMEEIKDRIRETFHTIKNLILS